MNDISVLVSNRLKEIRKSLHLSQAKFAEMMGIPQSTYSKYELGGAIPDSVLLVLDRLGINLNWFITGEGSPSKNQDDNSKTTDSDLITPSGKVLQSDQNSDRCCIPILASRVSAGPGEEWEPADFREDETLPILAKFVKTYKKEDIFSAEVKGDSMMDASILDGDYVIAVRGLIEGDGIYVLAIGSEVLVKRLHYDPFDNMVDVISENPHYAKKTVTPDSITVLGKVIGWLHRYPY